MAYCTTFYKLLESLVHPSNVGSWTECGDGQLRWHWPVILILATDYEEACVMSLIRGLQGYYPCPMCFVPHDAQSDLSSEHPLRTDKGSEQIITEARALRTPGEREEMLKGRVLRNVNNAFWKIRDADPHSAISYDPLHSDDGDFGTSLKERKRARHRASQYFIDEGKLWRLGGGVGVRARPRRECLTRPEARVKAMKAHTEGGHFHRDSINGSID
ncbi:hypothetical protein B0H19DRAFT_1069323 [Mycena capillaripes]|nr:hypothetical protein B0H19DRAFT_1069323 [Mycena capillaripes]